MSYVVSKNPIIVKDLSKLDPTSREGNPNNYSELDFRKLEVVPVGVPDKYLKWDNGNPENGTLVEMATTEKAQVDANELITAKTKQSQLITDAAENEVDSVMGNIKNKYILGYLFLRDQNIAVDPFTVEQKQGLAAELVKSFSRATQLLTQIGQCTDIASVSAIKY